MDHEQVEFVEGAEADEEDSSDQPALSHAAAPSVRGTVYQIGVAVMKCFALTEGQSVYFEKFGDVTIPGQAQIETKHYAKTLGDWSPNLWKTLSNWIQEGFDPASFDHLILYTCQSFGKTAQIAQWNGLAIAEKEALIREIAQQILQKEEIRKAKAPKGKVPELAVWAARVVDPSNAVKFLQVVERFSIEIDSPKLPELHQQIKDLHLKGSIGTKRDEFLDALFGFVIRPEKINGVWVITHEEFVLKFQELTAQYCKGTVHFPKKYIRSSTLPEDDPQIAQHKGHRFVEKILEIEHGERVAEAVRDYLGAVNTIQKEFKDYAIAGDRTEDYTNSLRASFLKKHRNARAKVRTPILESQVFYDEITSEVAPPFEGFSVTPMEFKNGLLHTQLDDATLNLQWKVDPI